jgi:hypothetical protein
MKRSSRTVNSTARRGRTAAATLPSVAELRDAVKAAGLLARTTRKEAKDAAGELKRLKGALDKARKAASKQKALERAARSTAKPAARRAGKGAAKATARPTSSRTPAPVRRGRPPKTSRLEHEAPAPVAA